MAGKNWQAGGKNSIPALAALCLLAAAVPCELAWGAPPSGGFAPASYIGAFDPNPSPGQRIIPRNFGSGSSYFTLSLRVSRAVKGPDALTGCQRQGRFGGCPRFQREIERDAENGETLITLDDVFNDIAGGLPPSTCLKAQ